MDSAGNVYVSWVGYSSCFNSTGSATLYIAKSSDRGRTWKNIIIDHSAATYPCAQFQCGWQFLGAQLTMTTGKSASGADTLYTLWNKGTVDQGPERIYFASSADGGMTWSSSQLVSPAGVEAAFPSITASGTGGDVRIAWMDARNGGRWNVYYQKSSSSGSSWMTAVSLSGCTALPATCPSYATPAGFAFPYGDYFKIAVSGGGQTQAVWGEGPNWTGPGNIWYTSAP